MESTDLESLERRMQLDVYPPELEAEIEAWITDLYQGAAGQPGLAQRYWWLRSLFRARDVTDADIDEMMSETLSKYLGPVKSKLWAAAAGHYIKDEDTLMPAIRWVAAKLRQPVRKVLRECLYEHRHEELLDRYYGIDQITQEDLEEDWEREQILAGIGAPFALMPRGKPTPSQPLDPERLTYESPKAALEAIAKNVLIDHLRKLKSEKGRVDSEDLLESKEAPLDSDPHQLALAREMRRQLFGGGARTPRSPKSCLDLMSRSFSYYG